ncbi:putative AbiEi antitoxin of type IV toxin-antitoxin system [Jatrophihabitans sp. GAS493]|uniref:type IV toxin-antitoxin system AbiEi family antitoxin domain-containing protein n=1 Tax=Jatrophihabitans sp. GAS493 TaxID=1907575 RepID=UPI000BC0719E|nr:type IV toxin-antitoxin system AbiEi family antitoxin domain-containing protein [Jatrophihabitans sp. GAS493]SOD75126.1 putative AbiEi antitoxin of type IV toxin-antitoxin system [Jatrophihabitans sp. GAS493]
MRPLPAATAAQHGAFTTVQAIEAGWSRTALARAAQRGELVRIRRGTFCLAERLAAASPEERNRRLCTQVAAALLTMPSAVASQGSAALLSGLPMLRTPRQPCITIAPGRGGSFEGLHVHRARLTADDAAATPEVGAGSATHALRRTSVGRTICDIAREYGRDAAVVTADAALHRTPGDRPSIASCLERSAGWPWIRRATDLLDLVDDRSESPLESMSRLRIRDLGLPPPELQSVLKDVGGRFLGRVDFFWPQFGVVGEADGFEKYATAPMEVLRAEKLRQERLEQIGLVVVRWGWAEVNRPEILQNRLVNAFVRGQRRPASHRGWFAQQAG